MKNHWFKLTFLNHLLVIIKMFSLDLRCRSFICVFKISQADLEKRGVLLFIHLAMKGKLFINKVKVTTYIIWQRNITGTQRTSQGLCSLFQNFVVFFRQQGEQTEKIKQRLQLYQNNQVSPLPGLTWDYIVPQNVNHSKTHV